MVEASLWGAGGLYGREPMPSTIIPTLSRLSTLALTQSVTDIIVSFYSHKRMFSDSKQQTCLVWGGVSERECRGNGDIHCVSGRSRWRSCLCMDRGGCSWGLQQSDSDVHVDTWGYGTIYSYVSLCMILPYGKKIQMYNNDYSKHIRMLFFKVNMHRT